MCPSAPRVCSEPGGQKPVPSLSLDRILTWCQMESDEQILAQYFDGNWKIFIQEYVFENVDCKMATVLSRPQRVNSEIQRNLGNGGNRFSNFHPPPVDPPHTGPVIMITSWHGKVLRIMYPLWGKSWWPHDMTHFCIAGPLWGESTDHRWPTQGSELRLFLYLTEQAIEQTVKLPVIWEASTLTWRHCDTLHKAPVTLVLSLLSAWTTVERFVCNVVEIPPRRIGHRVQM